MSEKHAWTDRDKSGHLALFAGTGSNTKVHAAAILGRERSWPVYRVDLRIVYSKYIGEFEKNLVKLLVKARRGNCVLFFDEADILFGGLSKGPDSHSRYANQEVSYLMQRMEESPGISILAIDQYKNLDDAFLRRFHSLVHFPGPTRAKDISSGKTP